MSKQKIFLGPAGTPLSSKGGSLDAVSDVKALGLKAMEVQFVRGVKMKGELAKKVGEEAKTHDIRLSVHAPYYINLASAEAEKVEASKNMILRSADRAEKMGASPVVLHPAYYGKRSKEEVFDMVLEACEELASKIPKGVKLGLETGGKKSSFGSVDEIVDVCKKANACVPVIDFSHIYARQVGNIDYAEVLDALKPLKLKHIHSHFSNIEFTDKGEREHLPLDGRPPFRPLAEEIVDRKLDITIICESPKLELDSLLMKKTFQDVGYEFDY